MGQQLLRAGAPLLAAALSEGTAVALVGEALTVEVPPARIALLADPEQQRVLGSALLAVLGIRLRLVPRVRSVRGGGGGGGGGGDSDEPVTDERQRRYKAAQEHPLVRDLMQRFEADLVGRELIDLETWLTRLAEERAKGSRRRYRGDLHLDGVSTGHADD